MRIDPGGGGRHLRFDNMMKRSGDGALKGDADWTERSIVLDVPYTAASIHFGCLLHEKGAVWARNFHFETVDDDVPISQDGPFPPRPTNLGFDIN
ncbi:transcriptional regulator, AraC family [Pelagibacterium halotolerans B2]|uniref:Transcriptional regulator, AraC family n=2 Tax=Pelagibacterium TaxID=1082930 RepID=G4R9L2_PELHB|nr:transcriptional regulator, AraC family [Pelagibacterium halotolerans B2]